MLLWGIALVKQPAEDLSMLKLLVILVMFAMAVSLFSGLFFLVRDRGKSDRTVISLSIRVALAFVLLVLLALGFMARMNTPGA